LLHNECNWLVGIAERRPELVSDRVLEYLAQFD